MSVHHRLPNNWDYIKTMVINVNRLAPKTRGATSWQHIAGSYGEQQKSNQNSWFHIGETF